ncbi:MAG: hypothetical protein QM648_10485 [Solirubrobacterales bacterium]
MINAANSSAGSAYASGALVGNLIGALLTGLLFAWGVTRYDGVEAAEPRHMWPIALASSVAAVVLGALLS